MRNIAAEKGKTQKYQVLAALNEFKSFTVEVFLT